MWNKNLVRDCVIIGAGPASSTAAIYEIRSDLAVKLGAKYLPNKCLLVDEHQ